MMKKVFVFVLILTLLVSPLLPMYEVKAKTLRDYYAEYEALESKKNESAAQKAEREAKIREFSQNIETSRQNITNAQQGIKETKDKINELNLEIENKKKEIENLLKFKQISSGDNIYLEYVFGASDFTDFIYRSAIVEQLSRYNDELIDEMNRLIEENKALAIELEKKIEEEKSAIASFESMLATLHIEIDDLSEMQKDVDAEMKALEEEINYLEEHGCSLDEDISDCIDMPYASGFIRPLVYGSVTSSYGWRFHPTLGYERLHAGIDLGVWEGSKVYAAAAGIVSSIVEYSSCGGNIVRIQHLIGGERYTTVYMHLLSINVSLGDVVTSNSVIGYSGGYTTSSYYGGYDGCTTGGHLHFEIHYGYDYSNDSSTDPTNFIYFPSEFDSRYE